MRRAAEREVEALESSARVAAKIVGMCPSCGVDVVGGEAHEAECTEAAQ